MRIREELVTQMPFESSDGTVSLEAVREDYEYREERIDPDFPHLLVRLVVWDPTKMYIRDVKEQSIRMPDLPPELANHGGRTYNFVLALKRVLSEVLSRPDIESRLPSDLLKFHPLGKKTFGTVEEFEASLRRRSNLGGYL